MKVLKRDGASAEESPPPPGTGPQGGESKEQHKERRQIMLTRLDLRFSPYLFVAPFFLLFGVFGLFPILFTFWVSLHEWSFIGGNQGFLGAENYAFLLGDEKFWNALVNTLGIFLLAIVPQLLVALLLADTLNRRIKWRGFFRVGIIIPYITSIAAMAIVFGQLFGREYGMINYALEFIGITGPDWRSDRIASWSAIAVMVDWRWLGFNTLIYLAAMQSIPRDLYESAALDGASRLRQFWQITIPMVRPTIIFTVIISTIGQMQLFTEPVIFSADYSGGSQGQFQTLAMLMYDEAMRLNNFGYGAAVAWAVFVLIVIFSLINVLFVSRIQRAD